MCAISSWGKTTRVVRWSNKFTIVTIERATVRLVRGIRWFYSWDYSGLQVSQASEYVNVRADNLATPLILLMICCKKRGRVERLKDTGLVRRSSWFFAPPSYGQRRKSTHSVGREGEIDELSCLLRSPQERKENGVRSRLAKQFGDERREKEEKESNGAVRSLHHQKLRRNQVCPVTVAKIRANSRIQKH